MFATSPANADRAPASLSVAALRRLALVLALAAGMLALASPHTAAAEDHPGTIAPDAQGHPSRGLRG